MTKYRFSDIPDEMITKDYFPIGRHLWRIYTHLGPRLLMKWHMKYSDNINGLMSERLDSAIVTGRAMRQDKIEAPDKTLSFNFIPSINMIRCDLQTGALKQLYGESADCTFVMVDDVFQEIFFLINTHIEEGFPINWWIAPRDDEILNTRHKKLGLKLRNLPKNLKNLQKVGIYLLDILKDIRNERNPKYTQSTYNVIIAYATNVANLITELSSYEVFNAFWTSLQLKYKYSQLRDYHAVFHPVPAYVKTIIQRGRNANTLQMNKLYLDSKLAIHAIEENWQNLLFDELPELWDIGVGWQLREGVVTPKQSLQSKLPDIGDPKVIEAEEFDFIYPEGERVTPEGLGIKEQEFLSGVYLNVNHETPLNEKITKSHIISIGLGRKAKIY